jgi:hypothetical protein
MLQVCDCRALGTFRLDEVSAPKVDVSRGEVVDAFVIVHVVIVSDEGMI